MWLNVVHGPRGVTVHPPPPLPPGSSMSGIILFGVALSTCWWLLIIVSGGEGFNFLAGMVSICPLLWQRDVKLQQAQNIPEILIDNDNLMDVDEDSDEYTDESSSELVDNVPYINDTESDDDDN